ncbi:MAG: hypothetical protein UIC64_09360 [Agathobacter sp.]|nr:hypothetical protein [Agathobacter sp.]
MRVKGSYTLEASVYIPIVIFVMAIAMRLCIVLYQEIRDEREQDEVVNMWVVDEFYTYKLVGKFGEEIEGYINDQ